MGSGTRPAYLAEFAGSVRRFLLQMAAWAALVTAGLYVAGYGGKVAGFLAGTAVSIIYFLLLGYRVRRSAAMPPKQAVAYMRMGWVIRLAFVALAVIWMLKVPAIDFTGAILGLFSFKIVLLLNGFWLVVRRRAAQ